MERTMDVKRGDKVWALVGYPMKPKRVTAVSHRMSDRLSEGYIDTEEGFKVYESLVYKKKPKKIVVSDSYGSYTVWQ